MRASQSSPSLLPLTTDARITCEHARKLPRRPGKLERANIPSAALQKYQRPHDVLRILCSPSSEPSSTAAHCARLAPQANVRRRCPRSPARSRADQTPPVESVRPYSAADRSMMRSWTRTVSSLVSFLTWRSAHRVGSLGGVSRAFRHAGWARLLAPEPIKLHRRSRTSVLSGVQVDDALVDADGVLLGEFPHVAQRAQGQQSGYGE
jgi:hypothetical protein